MVRFRIGHFMILIAVAAPLLLCLRTLIEHGPGLENFGRTVSAAFFLFCGLTVIGCFTVACLRGSPEQQKRRFHLPPTEDLAEIKRQWAKVVSILRWAFGR